MKKNVILRFGQEVNIVRGFYKGQSGKVLLRHPASPEDNYDIRIKLDDQYFVSKDQPLSDLELIKMESE